MTKAREIAASLEDKIALTEKLGLEADVVLTKDAALAIVDLLRLSDWMAGEIDRLKGQKLPGPLTETAANPKVAPRE